MHVTFVATGVKYKRIEDEEEDLSIVLATTPKVTSARTRGSEVQARNSRIE